MLEKNEKYQKLSKYLTNNDIQLTYNIAIKSMTTLNRNSAILMHKYNANCSTDITGFGLLGHAQNLVEFQKNNLNFIINKLPIIKNVRKIGEILEQDKKLLNGKAVETSGGLLICLNSQNAQKFCNEYTKMYNDNNNIKNDNNQQQKAWIIGYVTEGNRNASLIDKPEFIDVEL